MIGRSFLGLLGAAAECASAPGGSRAIQGRRGSPGLLTLAAEMAR